MTFIELDLNAVRNNLKTLATILGGEHKIIPVLKCDAYGVGIATLAKVVIDSSVTLVAVANVAEATTLRESGYHRDIMLFAPASSLNDADIQECIEGQFSPTISSPDCVSYLESHPQWHKLSLHLNIETGMHRYGAEPTTELFASLRTIRPRIKTVYSHLPQQFDLADSNQRVASFRTSTKDIDLPCHIYRTSNALTLPAENLSEFDYHRVGLGLYGISPSATASGSSPLSSSNSSNLTVPLTPAIRVLSTVVCIKEVLKGGGAGYDHDFIATRDTRLAVIPVGYFHGLPLSASGQLQFKLNGVSVPQVGQIGMDATMIDITDVSAASVGDEVVLFDGSTKAMNHWCSASNLSVWEVLTGLAKSSGDVRCNEIESENLELPEHA